MQWEYTPLWRMGGVGSGSTHHCGGWGECVVGVCMNNIINITTIICSHRTSTNH